MFLTGNLLLGLHLNSSIISIYIFLYKVDQDVFLIIFHGVLFLITSLFYMKVLISDPGFVKNKINVKQTLQKNTSPSKICADCEV